MGHPITLGINTFHSLCSNLWMIHPSSNCYLPKTGIRHSVPYIVFTALTDCRSSRVIELPRRHAPPGRRRGVMIGAPLPPRFSVTLPAKQNAPPLIRRERGIVSNFWADFGFDHIWFPASLSEGVLAPGA